MKKLLLVVVAMLATSVAFAQVCPRPGMPQSSTPLSAVKGVQDLPTWSHIHSPFSTTDINGEPVNVADTLAAGKYIVVDYSATWCGPCYRFHQSKNLEAIHNQLGDSVCVLWVEADNSTTLNDIYGTGSNTQGDWTQYSDGTPVSYRIIDCASCESMIDPTGYVPAVYFVTPSGYFCHIYGETWGFGITTSNADAVAAVRNLIQMSPAPNTPPSVAINGFSTVVANVPTTFTANYISVDSVISIVWDFPGGTPATATGATASASWSTTGTRTISCTVTNTTGSTTATMDVNVIEWTWGDEMDYSNNGSVATSFRAGSPTTWGVKYPAALLGDRHYVESVKVYSSYNATYTLSIYQPASGNTPSNSNLVYQFDYPVSEGNYNVLPIYGQVGIDNTNDLWVVFECGDADYPAACTDYTGDANGSMIVIQGEWTNLPALGSDYAYTWMIKTVTSDDAPFNVALIGPSSTTANVPTEFSVAGPASATYQWTIDGGNPATASSNHVSVTWAAPGTYTVSVVATLGSETRTVTRQVVVNDCATPRDLPFTEGFENGLDDCWTIIDADGDGYTWMCPGVGQAHTGSGFVASASYINDVGVLHPDNWLITPKIHIPAEGATIEWWEYAVYTDYQENYSVMVSTTDNNISSFTGTVFSGIPASPQTWAKHSRSLGEYAGQDIYVAFRHFNCYDQYWLDIDDLSITAGVHAGIAEANNAQVDIYPNPTSGKLYISAEGIQEVSIVDVDGRVVLNTKNTNVIDMTSFNNGVYFVRVITANGTATQKIVKK